MGIYACVQRQDAVFFGLLDDWIVEWEGASFDERNAMYYTVRNRYNANSRSATAQAADFFLLRELAYGGMFRVNSRGEFNVPFGRAYAFNKNLREKVDHLRSDVVREKMMCANLEAMDFRDFLDGHDFNGNDFMFVDPPYDTRFSKYDRHDFDGNDQARLAEWLRKYPGQFMLICKLTPMVEHLYLKYPQWHVYRYQREYRFNIKGRFPRSVTHVMVMNYDTNF